MSSKPGSQTVTSTDDNADDETKRSVEAAEPSDQPSISPTAVAFILLGLSLPVFLIALDTSIVATAIPYITDRFRSTQDIGWYGSAYFLALCSLQPISGKLYATFSLKWTFLSFFAVFELGSLLCATAVSSNMFIGGRAVAGAGGAGIVSGAFSIVAFIAPLQKRPLYIGFISSFFGVAAVIGPLIGGAFTEHVSWRWCFYINLPIGAVAGLVLILVFNPPTRAIETDPIARRIRALDLIGASLFIPAILMALLALQWGGSTYAWKSATIIGLFLGFGGLCVVFVLWQIYKGEEAMLPMTILLNRTVAFSSLTLAFAYGAIFSVVYYLPEWFQVVKGAGPIRSGVMNLPTFIPQIAAALLSGALAPKLGPLNPWVYIGCALMAIGIGLYGTFDLSTPSSHWIGYQILPGIGFGLMAQMPVVAVQASLPTSQSPLGVSTATFSQFFGSAIFLAISQAVFSNIFINKLTVDIPGVDLQSLIASGSGAIRKLVPPDDLPVVLGAFNQALVGTFYLSAAASAAAVLISFGIPWINIKGKNLVMEPGA
ncbi:major facilitator superfamily domain-containing protein [Trichoderma asperelloides]|nr:major facilitator superfamily domain-containing protein [Trichoderma asperelloides]